METVTFFTSAIVGSYTYIATTYIHVSVKTKEASGEYLPLVNPPRMREGYGSRFVSVYVCVCYHASYYRILSKIPDTLIVRTPKYVIFSRSNRTGHGNSMGFPPL